MKLSSLISTLQKIQKEHDSPENLDVVIPIYQPGSFGGTPCVSVDAIVSGFDWDMNRVFLNPSQNLTKLTPEEVQDILTSVQKGDSWHSYQEYKKLRDKIKELEARITELSSQSS